MKSCKHCNKPRQSGQSYCPEHKAQYDHLRYLRRKNGYGFALDTPCPICDVVGSCNMATSDMIFCVNKREGHYHTLPNGWLHKIK